MPAVHHGYPERLPGALPKKLVYQHPDEGRVVVERLFPQEIPEVAALIVDLLHDAYRQQFEVPVAGRAIAPEGTMDAAFDVGNREALAARIARMQSDMHKKRSTYWIVGGREPARGMLPLEALAKVSDSCATVWQKLGLVGANCYVDQIASRPHHDADGVPHRRHHGSMVLHAALVGGGFGAQRQVVADVHGQGSSMAFFAAAGLTPQAEPCEPTIFNADTPQEFALQNVRYGGQTVNETITMLQRQAPWLAQATSEY